MRENIKQHIVQQKYLENFATLKKKEYLIDVFDKNKNEVRKKQNIKNVAEENCFYDFDYVKLINALEEDGYFFDNKTKIMAENHGEKVVEKRLLGTIESRLFPYLKEIIDCYKKTPKDNLINAKAIQDDCKLAVSNYIIAQYVRTKKYRDDRVQRESDNQDIKAFLNENNFPYEPYKHAQYLSDAKFFDFATNRLIEEIWFVAVSENNQFFTSDNPVVNYNSQKFAGIGAFGSELIFPLTSEIALVIIDQIYFHTRLDINNRYLLVKNNFVDMHNKLQYSNADRQIFAKNSDFQIIRG